MIEYRSVGRDDQDKIRAFLAENGWEKRVADTERFERMIENASRTVVACERDRVVGFARAITDGVSNGYIGTVAVAGDKRGLGIGRELVTQLMGGRFRER
jgi:ribosomal protein S18 acetylase RimI-like enzyme